MKIKKLIELLEDFDKNLDILVDGDFIDRIDLVVPTEKYAIPYVNIIKEDTG